MDSLKFDESHAPLGKGFPFVAAAGCHFGWLNTGLATPQVKRVSGGAVAKRLLCSTGVLRPFLARLHNI